MGNIDKNRTTTVITTLAFSVLALAAIIYQHSFKEVLELETPVVDSGIAVSYTHLTLPTKRIV